MTDKIRQHRISFSHAWNGIVYAFSSQPNMRVHGIAAFLVVLLGLYFGLTQTEWVIITFTILVVWVAEMVNTAIESMTDLITMKFSRHAKAAKDVAAGMVLIAAIGSVIIAGLIFSPYISAMIK